MKKRETIRATLAALLSATAIGCSSEPEPKADTGAPPTSYQMVPATTGGGSAATTPTGTPPSTTSPATTPANGGNPPSAGSD